MTLPIRPSVVATTNHAAMCKSQGATYSQWLRACDLHLAHLSQGTCTGTWALTVSEWRWQAAYEEDMLPSEAACRALNHANGVGEC